LLAARGPYGSEQPTKELTLPQMARQTWPAARPGRPLRYEY
jgi:hypothetical protein